MHDPLTKLMTALDERIRMNSSFSEEEKLEYIANIRLVQEYVDKEMASDEVDNFSEDSYSYN